MAEFYRIRKTNTVVELIRWISDKNDRFDSLHNKFLGRDILTGQEMTIWTCSNPEERFLTEMEVLAIVSKEAISD